MLFCLVDSTILESAVRSTTYVQRYMVLNRVSRQAHYLNDLWYFDTQEYRWKQVEFKDTERRPS